MYTLPKLVAFLIVSLAIFISTANAQYTKLQGYCEQGGQTVITQGLTSTTKIQRSFPSCTVRIFNAGTNDIATIYSDHTGTPKSNPFTASSTGLWFFYAAPGTAFDVQLANSGISPSFTLGDLVTPSMSSSSSFVDLTITNNLIQGTSSQLYTANPSPILTTNDYGSAPFLFQPTFSYQDPTHFRSVGVGSKPVFGTTTGAETIFWTPYWFIFGSNSSPIPLGTKGNPSGYEANIFTAQSSSDMNEAAHAFGATIVGTGGANLYGTAITIQASTVAASMRGININLQTSIAGGTQYAYLADSTGSVQPPTAGYAISGSFTTGLELQGATLTNAIRIPNNIPIIARNQANNANVNVIKLNTNNLLEFGTNTVNLNSNPSFGLGDGSSTGWTVQMVDADGRLRLFKGGVGEVVTFYNDGTIQQLGILFANLGTPSNGRVIYCTDCTNASNPCTGSGSGAFAKRLSGSWDCR